MDYARGMRLSNRELATLCYALAAARAREDARGSSGPLLARLIAVARARGMNTAVDRTIAIMAAGPPSPSVARLVGRVGDGRRPDLRARQLERLRRKALSR
jgi:hypothetical protein